MSQSNVIILTTESPVPGIARFLNDLSNKRFYGKVEIQYQEGEIVVVRKEETLKPSFFV
jgi:hypothetical protein